MSAVQCSQKWSGKKRVLWGIRKLVMGAMSITPQVDSSE